MSSNNNFKETFLTKKGEDVTFGEDSTDLMVVNSNAEFTGTLTANGVVFQKPPAFEYITSSDRPVGITVDASNPQKELTGFTLNITPSSSGSKILLSVHVMGEWQNWPSQKGIIIQRQIGSGTPDFLRPDAPTSQPNRGRIIANFNDSMAPLNGGNDNSTMESCSFIYVDTPNTTAQITYKLFLVNTEYNQTSSYFNLNSTINVGNNQVTYEVGSSTFTAEEKI